MSAAARPVTGVRTVAIVGAPNSGKSTLFNRLTGLHQKVANYPGVTVEGRVGRLTLAGGRRVRLIDLPGTYSLRAASEDERVVVRALEDGFPGAGRPGAILLVLDVTNLARNLALAAPVLALGLPTLVILNMADDLADRGGEVDTASLSRELGAEVALVSAVTGAGLGRVRAFLDSAFAAPGRTTLPVIDNAPACRAWAGRIAEQSAYRAPVPSAWTARLDTLFLHPILGPLVFAAVVVVVFQAMFGLARPLMSAVEWLVAGSGGLIGAALPATWLRDLLLEGVWSGVGAVVVFLPQILLLFLLIGVLEDSGYLARAAVIADRTMARIGLQGKSFIPLLAAHACAVPAVLAARTIENRRDRLATILIAPFMTCAARLPVYTLIIAAFIPERPLLGPLIGTRAAALLALYALGFLAAIGTARVLKSTILKSDRTVFLLELPPYRWPTARSLWLRLVERARVFLVRAGTVILAVSVVLWALAHLPLHREAGQAGIGGSVAGTVGRAIEPVIAPLGFDWKIGVGLVTSLAAREVIVGTLGTLNGIEAAEGDAAGSPSAALERALRADLAPGGAAALLVFFALAMQCVSTIAVVRRETGGWRLPALQFGYMLALAYGGAWLANVTVTAVLQ
ncbi:MAG: ferrous iron transporter B [Gemmatimonadetes bacterium GWC2_71_10]|nr:MAG: ferrous iron transporter B [Gemmatimonadetes bacterium GWC2_71_10]